MKEEKEYSLSESLLFVDIPKEKQAEVVKAVQKELVPAHSIIFRQGDPGDKFYVITSGKVRIFRKSKDGLETDLSWLGPGDSFGEMALLTEKVRSAYAETLEETHFLVLAKDQFDRIVKNNACISMAFIKQMSDWLVRDEIKIEKEAERQLQAPKMSYVDFLVIISVSLLCGIIFNLVNPNGINILPISLTGEQIPGASLSMAIEKYKQGKNIFVDARPASFYEQGHIKGSVNVPSAMFDLIYMMELSDTEKQKDIIVYGRTISSLYDIQVAKKLILRGHKSTMILDSEFSAWKNKGFPVAP